MTIDELERIIRDAFRNVRLGDGINLIDADQMDNWGEIASDANMYPEAKQGDDWTKISLETLDRFPSLSHIDAKGFRYYIPAFMLSTLKHYEPREMRWINVSSALDPRGQLRDYVLSRYELLNDAQIRAIALFMAELPNLLSMDATDARMLQRAVTAYWHQYL